MPLSPHRYKDALHQSRERCFSAADEAMQPLQRVHAFTHDVDCVLMEIFNGFVPQGQKSPGVCLVALGGYGRGELCPCSDIDILILHNGRTVPTGVALAVRLFWDIGLTMGCVVRTIDECVNILGKDIATDTAFLESRFLTGDKALFRLLLRKGIEPYFSKRKKFFIKEMREYLHEELYSAEDSLYRIEPDLKNGFCTLRDCHRLLWSERLRTGIGSMQELSSRSHFPISQTNRFCADYEFLIGLRSSLHSICGRRMDVLETALQPDVALRYGLGDQGAGVLLERFFKTVRSIRLFLLSYLEKSPADGSVWRYLRRRIGSIKAAPGVSVCEGVVFPSDNNIQRLINPLWIMTVFRQALHYRATLSVELRNKIRYAVSRLSAGDFKSQEVEATFRGMLGFDGPVGHVFQLMHETGVLARIIPQMEKLTCKVEYDSYHEFTVDQHILQTLAAADELSRDPDPVLRRLHDNRDYTPLLRLGLLLHDIGKALPGDHVVNGAIEAEAVCERLGLDYKESARIRFLVYHHLDMSDLSFHREPEPHALAGFARLVGDVTNLDLLYLLTVLDIRCVGRNTWTAWKAYQLEQIYTGVRSMLTASGEAGPAESAGTDDGAIYYTRDTLPEDRRKYSQWLDALPRGELQIHSDAFNGFERLALCGWDRMGFLGDIIGCMSSEGFNILSAHIFSMPDGKVLDIFYVEPPQYPEISSEQRTKNILRKWELLRAKAATADSLVAERLRLYPLKRLRFSPRGTQVTIDNASSPRTTLLEIRTPDNFGILHKIVQCLNRSSVNIRSARLSTRIDQAFDVFYVTDSRGEKIVDEDALAALTGKLTEALG